jgi:hypothetical protein
MVEPLIRIGRADPVSGHYPEIDLSPDDTVSRRHAEIRRVEAGYELVDCGSTNGTLVNGKELQPDRPRAIKVGDDLAIGTNIVLKVIVAEAPAEVVVQPAPPVPEPAPPPAPIEMEQPAFEPPPPVAEPVDEEEESETIVYGRDSQPAGLPPAPDFPIALRGYDREAVNRYVAEVRDHVAASEGQMSRLRDEVEALRARPGGGSGAPQDTSQTAAELDKARARIRELEDNQDSVQRALIVAQRAADQLRSEAEQTARETIAKAQAEIGQLDEQIRTRREDIERQISEEVGQRREEALRAIDDAKIKAEEARTRAVKEAEELIAATRARIDQEQQEAESGRATRLADLEARIEQAQAGLQSAEHQRRAFEDEWAGRLRELAALVQSMLQTSAEGAGRSSSHRPGGSESEEGAIAG